MLRFASLFSLSCARTSLLRGCILLLATSASAQNRFCLGGDLDHLSAPERAACTAKMGAVRSAAQRFGAPQDWHFVMVCGAEGWKTYSDFSARSRAELERSSADTDLTTRATYLREERFNAGQLTAASERLLAHEIAGIVLQTTDEAAILARVNLWMAQSTVGSPVEAPVLSASR